ncbi:acyl-CoA N-acyltransferase [Microdochium trichocladiopsis]|uniref:Acyl-CoA N-acyltransferase n=1 Tax=Microdochium trichocladiopsis TaxID=1682393 RepID=A0A9P8Y7B1_9PEZI|nr:acyl-CoA N-acyltransferase [Microdochium trichocladiopsis]KAH7031465.1 acyl-CoA N-acyltransferase [Microdochium trichocladiopsis]
MAFDPFRSKNLIYRAVEDNPEDEAFLHSIQLDTVSLSGNTIHLLVPQGKAHTKKLSDILRNNALIAVMICLPPATDSGNESGATATPIGIIALSKSHPNGVQNRNAGIAISIYKDFQNKGYGSEAIRWILGYAFVMAGMHSVSIETVSFNERAIYLYKKLGFVPEGRRRQQVWFRGAWHDFVELGMLESEYREMQEKEGKSWAEDTTL